MSQTRDEKLDTLLLDVAAMKAMMTEFLKARASAAPPPVSAGPVADDDELDSQYGNPQVKKDPPRWKGDSFAGCRFSECPPDYLDVLASLFDWQARKDDEQGKTWTNKNGEDVPSSTFKRKDAARARGWAARIRSGTIKQAPHVTPVADDGIPF